MTRQGETARPRVILADEISLACEAAAKWTPREFAWLSLALATGLRIHELRALDASDMTDGALVRRRVALRVWKGRTRPRQKSNGPPQEIYLPESLVPIVSEFLAWKRMHEESTDPGAPLFCSRGAGGKPRKDGAALQPRDKRMSLPALRWAWREIQRRAGFATRYNFHALRHTSMTAAYRRTRDLRLVQVLARHSSPATTAIYAHISPDEVLEIVREW